MKKFVLTLTLGLLTLCGTQAQNIHLANDLGIAENEVEAIKERIANKVDELQRNIQDMAGIGTMSHKGKMEVCNITLKLFIGEGNEYDTLVMTPYGYEPKRHQAVQMGYINSKALKKRQYKPMRDYFRQLINRSEDPKYRYKKVVIEAADAVRVDNLSRTGDGHYMATAHILQHFCGYSGDGRLMYHDYTAKTVTIYIDRIDISAPDGELITIWDIKLGDIDCNDIW